MIKFFLTKFLLFIISTCLFSACYLLPVLVKDEPKKLGSWNHGAMVSAANPYAVETAIKILEKGGSAVDAAIAAHAVLGLVEPQSSGLGGGGFLLHYNYDDNNLTFIDGRETAPGSATFDMFMKDDGNVMDFLEAWPSGKAVGTPGIVALYSTAHATHGVLPWSELFNHAITLAENGFIVSSRLADFLVVAKKRGRLAINSRTKKYFYPDEEPLQIGDLLNNPEYANTLIRIAKEGASAFYSGPIADAILAAVQEEPNPGGLTLSDLRNYKTIIRPVICGPFRDMNICTTSPPSSGGALIMIAGLYDHLVKTKASQADKVLAFVDAQRLAYADRYHYFGDPDEVAIEDMFFATNVKSALKLGQTRGIAVLSAVNEGKPVAEYSPLEVKQSVVGYGRAEKAQVQDMVTSLLRLKEKPEPLDASDALAVAICHIHAATANSRIETAKGT